MGNLILAILCFVAVSVFNFVVVKYIKRGWELTFLLVMWGMLYALVLSEYDNYLMHKALNVYQGNTNLNITYTDSIAIDSMVVFRE